MSKQSYGDPAKGLLGVPRGPKNRSQMSSDLLSLSTHCHEFLSLCQVQGHKWPIEVQGPSESSKAVTRGSIGAATPGFLNLNCELGGDIPPALVYLIQNAQILPKFAKCCQVNPEDYLGSPEVHLLKCSSLSWAKLLIYEFYPCHPYTWLHKP